MCDLPKRHDYHNIDTHAHMYEHACIRIGHACTHV